MTAANKLSDERFNVLAVEALMMITDSHGIHFLEEPSDEDLADKAKALGATVDEVRAFAQEMLRRHAVRYLEKHHPSVLNRKPMGGG
jgi:hypothetical protein